MRVLKSKSLQNIGIYLVANVIAKFIPLLLMPIITKFLAPEEYGKWSIFSTILLFSIPFIGLLLKNQITRKYYKLSKEKLGELIYNILIINVFLTVLAFLVIYILTFSDKNFITTHYLYVIPFMALFITTKEYFLTILRYEKRPALYGFFEITSSVVSYAIAILLIIQYNHKWEGLLIGSVFASMLMACFAFLYLLKKKYINFSFNASYIMSSLKIGLSLLPHAIGGSAIAISDRLILKKMLDVEIVGIYTIGYALGMTAQIVVDAFNKTWGPWIYEQLAQITDKKKKQIVKFTYIYYILLPFLWIGVCATGYIYMKWFINPKYHAALPVIYWSAGAAIIRGFYVAVFPYMTHLGKTIIYPVTTLFAALFNIVLTIYLVKINGMVGAAQATAAAFFLMFVSVFTYSQKNYPMPWLTFKKR